MDYHRRTTAIVLACVLAGMLFAKPTHAGESATTSEFTDLFDGKTLTGWDGDPRFWRVEDGVIVGETTADTTPKKNTFLIHRGGEFDDFELRLSYQVEGYNSGVQYRSVDRGKWVVSGYQCDFEARWHKSKHKPEAAPTDTYTGMFFDEKGRNFLGQRGEMVIVRSKPNHAKKPLIEKIGSVGDPVKLESHIKREGWNELVVIAKSNQFIHIINGHVMAIGIDEDTSKRRASGLFAFQLHKGPPMKIQLKDIRVRRLAASVKQAAVRSKARRSPISISIRSSDERSYSKYEQYALRHAGDPAKGQLLFDDKRTNCVVCHKIAGKGGEVGVDLSRIGGKFDRPHLIESLLEPSRQIVEGYRTASVVTVDGKVVTGIVSQQSDQGVTIVDANAKLHVIQRSDIDEMSHSNVSLMPKGLANELSLEEFTDLIAYLESLRSGVQDKRGSAIAGPIAIPDGFEIQTIATGLDGVTALEVLPDGRVLVCEQQGRVRVIKNDELLTEPFVTLPVDSFWERGVIGVTHDPDFPRRPYIYVCWVAKEPYPHHHVSRFTMKGNVAIEGSEKLLLVGDDQTKMGGKKPAGHQGGALHFGKDGKLYIGIGEQTSGTPAQKLDTFLGKILRINADGSIPADNPFMDKAKGKYRAIWAYGARNPFTFAFRKSDGLMLINDVGGKSEEINVGRAGANYGWPVVEHGDMPKYKTDEFDGPIHWYGQSSLNGGDFCVTGKSWPKQWQGRYFFADYVQGWIRTLDPDSPRDVNTFLEGIRRPVDLRFAANGSFYVLLRNAWVIDNKFENGTGSLLRIRPKQKSEADDEHRKLSNAIHPQKGKIIRVSNALNAPVNSVVKRVDTEKVSIPVDSEVKKSHSTDPINLHDSLKLGPKPGDVYREYSIHNGGNFNWRVTDPNTKVKRAQRFLPNPVLTLNVRDLKGAIRAEAVLDRWGGHAGTRDKKIRFNEKDWITLPELTTTPEGHDPGRYHSQDNPVISVPLTHLISGDNTIEGTIGPNNKTHWGQWGLYSLILRVYYDPEQKDFSTGKIILPSTGTVLRDNPTVTLDCGGNAERIDVLAWYDGYDEDGDGIFCEWHESRFQANRGQPADLQDHVGTIDPSATVRKLTWNTHWIPDQKSKNIKLTAHIRDGNGLVFVTNVVEKLSLQRDAWSVKQYRATKVPEAFSVRNGSSKSCNIPIVTEARLENAKEAVLHYRTWEAYDGHHKPFQLNGHKHKNNGKNHHYDYDLLPIPVSQLNAGDNIFTIQSDTKHHMLEVLWPGPAITVRYRSK